MLSSTSSSNARLPSGPWGRTWGLTLVLAVTAITGAEAFWRTHGYRPNLIDDMDLWAMQRGNVPPGPGSVVLIGSSRNLVGIDTGVLRRELPGRAVVQLSITRGHPLAVLRDLAEDPTFSGVVLCDLLPTSLLPEFVEFQAPYVRYAARSFNLARRLERTLKTAVQGSLVINSTQLKPGFVGHAILAREWPKRMHVQFKPDRSKPTDFRMVDPRPSRVATRDANEPHFARAQWPDENGWIADIDRADAWIAKIQARGGKVVLLRLPYSYECRDQEDRYAPRAKYWDVLAARTHAIAINSEDVPSLSGYVCPDGSHLDFRDAKTFTEALVSELRRRGVFPPK